MNKPLVRISVIRLKELYEFALQASCDPGYQQVPPITDQLALSLSHNPYAAPEDPALFVAHVDDVCVGYLGLFSGLLRNGTIRSKIYWPLPFYVSQEFRTMGIGLLLIKKMLSLHIDFVGDDPNPSSAQVWRGLGLMDHVVTTSFTVLNLSKLRRAANAIHYVQRSFRRCGLGGLDFLFVAAIKVHDRLVYPALKYLVYSALLQPHKRQMKSVDFRGVDRISEDCCRRPHNADVEFVHGADWVNWKLNYPWFTANEPDDRKSGKYRFIANRKLYRSFAVELGSQLENRWRGFFSAVVSQEDEAKQKILKVAEYCRADHDAIGSLTFAVFFYARKYGADRVALPNDLVEDWTNSKLLRQFASVKERSYVLRPWSNSSPLAIALPKLQPELCDGHYVFM